MNSKFFVFLGALLLVLVLNAQTTSNPVVMTINNVPITKQDFEYVYNKNNANTGATKKDLNEYKNLFVDFKLKIEEAKAQGLDSTRQFIREFNNYKKQLIDPYLVDSLSEISVAKQEFDRQKENIEVSHILVRFSKPQNILPSDTLEAYNKAMEIRKRLVGKKAEDFGKVAAEVSEDGSAKRVDNPGYLGWATSLMFIAPFEDAMYSTKVGEISQPVRSIFGYHLIKVLNKRPDPGMAKVSHIMFGFGGPNPTQQVQDSLCLEAEKIYERLQNGEDFVTLCKEYSYDRQSAANGGLLGWITSDVTLPESFKTAAFALTKGGEISPIVKTEYGYHIIRLEEKKPRESWDAVKPTFMKRVLQSDRQEDILREKTKKLAKAYDFNLNKPVYDELKAAVNTSYPFDSVFVAKYENNNEALFTIAGKPYTVKNFVEDRSKRKKQSTGKVSTEYLDDVLTGSAFSKLQDHQKEVLISENADVRNLIQEYHDGILLFDVMNKEVWEKASTDTLGLQEFFKKNQKKYNTWEGAKFKGFIVHCKTEDAMAKVKKVIASSPKSANLVANLKEAFASDSIPSIRIERGLWTNGENAYVDYSHYKSGDKPAPVNNFGFFFVHGKEIKAPEDYTDVKGLVVADYQDLLEEAWLKELRAKYPVKVNEDVLKTIER
ncbi:peptidyl-prolyl cis-trans isomerase SurA [Dysgonomonas sp. PH5-45]|uniref:peptidylprolyl isomerase n=1 Tax=unclassified Dysgonomonas TaxID=2630389 RepID=UPI002476C66C|nr:MULTISPECIES: peptidylprolyl isomerase [unclassified Dysgonomonas]MDH6355330.1 peptidyl-prolyl cis-trans isomerase SurA [Dysgonomonas sp. PH5-45]MDH6388228.1 peptidyl-prolyl cis-trans isomerase SurA [Dysgonomonas sp. PH5-37]